MRLVFRARGAIVVRVITVTTQGTASATVEYATAKYLRAVSRFLAVIGTLTLLGNVFALATGRFHGLRSMLEPFGASLVMVVFGALFLKGETKITAVFDGAARSVRWREKPTLGGAREVTVALGDVVKAKCWATVNYISLELEVKNGAPLALVRGEPRSEPARATMAQLVGKLRGLGVAVECDDTATGSWWKLPAA